MSDKLSSELKRLYLQTSKHSNYQVLAPSLMGILPDVGFKIETRHESARWLYLARHINFTDKTVVDVGGNTGFFTFNAVDAGAKYVEYFEGNDAHAEFVSLAAQLSNYQGHIHVQNQYIDLEHQALKKPVDVMFLLNVLHHIGDDYGNPNSDENLALEHINYVLNRLVKQTSLLILQLGFNWKGDINRPLFSQGTKAEMIEFIKKSVTDEWELLNIGIAERDNDVIEYKELSDSNIERVDELGEFLNRPIFILKNKTGL